MQLVLEQKVQPPICPKINTSLLLSVSFSGDHRKTGVPEARWSLAVHVAAGMVSCWGSAETVCPWQSHCVSADLEGREARGRSRVPGVQGTTCALKGEGGEVWEGGCVEEPGGGEEWGEYALEDCYLRGEGSLGTEIGPLCVPVTLLQLPLSDTGREHFSCPHTPIQESNLCWTCRVLKHRKFKVSVIVQEWVRSVGSSLGKGGG